MSLIKKLRRLSAREFEHLSYDLLTLSGLRNAVWRTPGPDAGRDIEGECFGTDLSETLSVQRWYVECKHYQTAVDWPTVFAKLAYASNHHADFLLLITTGHVSPRAKEEIALRSRRREWPAIRFWDAPALENLVARHSFLLEKYRLASAGTDLQRAAPLVALASKAVQSAHGHAALLGATSPPLELAAALVDLLAVRQAGWREGWSPFKPDRDGYDWLRLPKTPDLGKFDSYGLRALATATRFFSNATALVMQPGKESTWIIRLPRKVHSPTLGEALHTIALWANVEVVVRPTRVHLSARE